jgi:hypothetical protein
VKGVALYVFLTAALLAEAGAAAAQDSAAGKAAFGKCQASRRRVFVISHITNRTLN